MSQNSTVKKLYRSEKSKVFAGVSGGLAEYFDIDPTIVRLFFVLALLFGGSGLLAYFILWIFIPAKSSLKHKSEDYIKENVDELKDKVEILAKNARDGQSGLNTRFVGGIFLILIGTSFLLNNLGIFHIRFDFIWPLLLVALGISIISRR